MNLKLTISLELVVHLLPFGSDILPPASFTSNTPEQISHKFKSLSQKPSILPEDT